MGSPYSARVAGAGRRFGYTLRQRDQLGNWRDLSEYAKGWGYTTRLPGGHATCTFTLGGSWRTASEQVRPLDRIRVEHHGTTVWEGRVEGLPRQVDEVEAVQVAALGYAADLKARRFTAAAIDRDLSRWRAGSEVGTGYGQSTVPQVSPQTTDTSGQPAGAVTYPNGQAVATTDDAQLIYEALPGTTIKRLAFSWVGSTGGVGARIRFRVMAADTLPADPASGTWAETVVAYTDLNGSGSVAVNLSGTARRFLMLQVDVQAAHTPAADHGITFTSFYTSGLTNPATGNPFTDQDVYLREVVRALLPDYGEGVADDDFHLSRTFQLQNQAAWGTPVTLEDVLTQLNVVEGYEWGVFGDRLWLGNLNGFPYARNYVNAATPPTTPQNWVVLRREDGHAVQLEPSLDGAINEVLVLYTGADGRPTSYTEQRFDDVSNPLNGPDASAPLQVRTGVIELPGRQTLAVAQQAAAVLLNDRARVIVKGTVRLALAELNERAQSNVTIANSNTGPVVPRRVTEIMPGYWVHIADADGTPSATQPYTSSGVYPPPGLLPLREVQVDCDTGLVTWQLDATRDGLSTWLARLQSAAGVAG